MLNPFVLLFHGWIIVFYILSIRWIYFKNGAEFLEKHPGIAQKRGMGGESDLTAKQIKLFFPLMLLGGLVGMCMMWFEVLPITR